MNPKDEIKVVEGIFKENEIFEYTLKRPPAARKAAQDYFRQSSTFVNKFIYMVAADEFYKQINPIILAFEESYVN